MKPKLSIVIPVLNEGGGLSQSLQLLQPLRTVCELIVVDGGSDDGGPSVAAPWVDRLLTGPRGRAKQMNTGAAEARADVLLFLHADTRLPGGAVERILRTVEGGGRWGRFDVQFDAASPVFKLIALMMNWRSRSTGIATGDQAIFVTRPAFDAVGGFPDIALMEDIAISARLKQFATPCCLRDKVTTSARRWRQNGVVKTVLLMWRLRLAYFFGADPGALASRYYRRS